GGTNCRVVVFAEEFSNKFVRVLPLPNPNALVRAHNRQVEELCRWSEIFDVEPRPEVHLDVVDLRLVRANDEHVVDVGNDHHELVPLTSSVDTPVRSSAGKSVVTQNLAQVVSPFPAGLPQPIEGFAKHEYSTGREVASRRRKHVDEFMQVGVRVSADHIQGVDEPVVASSNRDASAHSSIGNCWRVGFEKVNSVLLSVTMGDESGFVASDVAVDVGLGRVHEHGGNWRAVVALCLGHRNYFPSAHLLQRLELNRHSLLPFVCVGSSKGLLDILWCLGHVYHNPCLTPALHGNHC
ncbi:hypothetical protein BCR44DRAFT_409121, partial [Catenaria anguillulae PL171]